MKRMQKSENPVTPVFESRAVIAKGELIGVYKKL